MSNPVLETVYSDDNLVAIGAAAVYTKAQELGWNCFVVYGKFSITEPEVKVTESGKKYLHVWQTENNQQCGMSAVMAIGKTEQGYHVYAVKSTDKAGKKTLWRKRVTGLNAYNLAMTNDHKLVKYDDGEQPAQKQATDFDNSF